MEAENFVVPPTIHRVEHQGYTNQESHRENPVRVADASSKRFDLPSLTTDLGSLDSEKYLKQGGAIKAALQDLSTSQIPTNQQTGGSRPTQEQYGVVDAPYPASDAHPPVSALFFISCSHLPL